LPLLLAYMIAVTSNHMQWLPLSCHHSDMANPRCTSLQ